MKHVTTDLFDYNATSLSEEFAPGAYMLRGFASSLEKDFLTAIGDVTTASPLRHMMTPGGFSMSVAMTNCGTSGWVTDKTGYRYTAIDPETKRSWPPMPEIFLHTAIRAATDAGYPSFIPDACLINRYEPGAKMSLHQDKDERTLDQPVVSLSFGLPAIFLFGGLSRSDKTMRLRLAHGDAIIWGGPARLRYHGILPLKDGVHPLFGNSRVNLTFRKAG